MKISIRELKRLDDIQYGIVQSITNLGSIVDQLYNSDVCTDPKLGEKVSHLFGLYSGIFSPIRECTGRMTEATPMGDCITNLRELDDIQYGLFELIYNLNRFTCSSEFIKEFPDGDLENNMAALRDKCNETLDAIRTCVGDLQATPSKFESTELEDVCSRLLSAIDDLARFIEISGLDEEYLDAKLSEKTTVFRSRCIEVIDSIRSLSKSK